MSVKVEWSPEAREDLEQIAQYIRRDSEAYARAVVSEVLTCSRTLSEYPLIGRIVPEMGDNTIRERFVYSYRIIYKVSTEKILIVAVVHGKRLLDLI